MGKNIPVQVGKESFPGKTAALKFVRSMLQRYSPGMKVKADDAVFLHALLQRHPEAKDKIGTGVDHFMVRSADFGTRCFWVVRADGSTERFSYKSCI